MWSMCNTILNGYEERLTETLKKYSKVCCDNYSSYLFKCTIELYDGYILK